MPDHGHTPARHPTPDTRYPYHLGRRHRAPDPREWAYRLVPPATVDRTQPRSLARFFPPIFDQGNEGSCFPPGTRVRLASGAERPIEDIRLLDEVVTAEGQTGRVMRTQVRIETERVFRLRLWGHAHLRLTGDHPVLTKRGYVSSSSLAPGDWVALPRYRPCEVREEIAPNDYIGPAPGVVWRERHARYAGVQGRVGIDLRVKAPPATIRLSGAFGRIVGLFLAEGSCDKTKVRWTFNRNEADTLVAELASLLSEELGIVPHVAMRPNNSINVTIFGLAWSRLFKALCGNGAGHKILHGDLTQGPEEFRRAALEGWLDGDGWHHPNGGRSGVSISHDLALSMYDLAQEFGLRPAIQWQRPILNAAAATRQPRWTVVLEANADNDRQELTEACVWRKVRSVDAEPYIGPVYNLSVEGDESYVAEGVGVHNCTANSSVAIQMALAAIAGQKPVTLSREELYYDERSDDGTFPQDAGSSVAESFDAVLKRKGLVADAVWPYDANPSEQPPAAVASAPRTLYLSAHQPIAGSDFLDGILAAFDQKQPVALGLTWYQEFFAQYEQTAVLSGSPASQIAGGQQLSGCIYVPPTAGKPETQPAGLIGCQNSWGATSPARTDLHPDARAGYVFLPVALFTNGTVDEVRAAVGVAPVPSPTPPPGTLQAQVDAILGQAQKQIDALLAASGGRA